MKQTKEEYINLRMTKDEASECARLLSEMVDLLQKSVYQSGEAPPEVISELIEDLTWLPHI